ncbi:hypothetical protein BKA70DRAFT_178773 [Coprinopsis sp. MPI-PUGE-AT-0042]|nr:hypothetical protein BKA70DRAFT_178773 [Coprinopsis sp. MPI-PUGE-AT-0042]
MKVNANLDESSPCIPILAALERSVCCHEAGVRPSFTRCSWHQGPDPGAQSALRALRVGGRVGRIEDVVPPPTPTLTGWLPRSLSVVRFVGSR